MAKYTGDWKDEEGVPFLQACSTKPLSPQGSVAMNTRLRPNEKPSFDRRKILIDFGKICRLWKDTLTPAIRLYWSTDMPLIANRKGTLIVPTPLRRYVNVQLSLLAFGFAPITTYEQRQAYDIENLDLLTANSGENLFTVYFSLAKMPGITNRSIMHIHQVPPRYVGKDTAWKYAKWIGSYNLSTDVMFPDYSSESIDVDAFYTIKEGVDAQVYIRITNSINYTPPTTFQRSHMTTEDWPSFIKAGEHI